MAARRRRNRNEDGTPTIYCEKAENLGRESLDLAKWGWDARETEPDDDDEEDDEYDRKPAARFPDMSPDDMRRHEFG